MTKCYLGTYVSDGGEGIYEFIFDENTGEFSGRKLLCEAKNSKYIISENDSIFTVFDGEKCSGVAVYSNNGQLIDSIEYEKSTSCYIIKHGNYIYTANYHEGTVTKLEFIDGKLKMIAHKLIIEESGSHQVIIFGDKLLVPCLLLDRLYILDGELNIIEFLQLPSKSGPRHGIISKDGKYLYLVGELDDRLYTFSIENEKLKLIDDISILPEKCPPAKSSAAIRMSKDGNTLIISVRNVNIIVVLDISNKVPKVVQHISSMGEHPRDILNTLDDRYLIVANRTSGNIVSFKLEDDKITKKCSEVSVAGAVSICCIVE